MGLAAGKEVFLLMEGGGGGAWVGLEEREGGGGGGARFTSMKKPKTWLSRGTGFGATSLIEMYLGTGGAESRS